MVDASAETVKLLVQWHEVCFEAGSLLPCDVTCLTEQFSLVSPLTVVRVVLAVPQFCKLGTTTQQKRDIGGVSVSRPYIMCAKIAPYTVG